MRLERHRLQKTTSLLFSPLTFLIYFTSHLFLPLFSSVFPTYSNSPLSEGSLSNWHHSWMLRAAVQGHCLFAQQQEEGRGREEGKKRPGCFWLGRDWRSFSGRVYLLGAGSQPTLLVRHGLQGGWILHPQSTTDLSLTVSYLQGFREGEREKWREIEEEERAPTIYSLSKASCYCSAKHKGGATSQRGRAKHRK